MTAFLPFLRSATTRGLRALWVRRIGPWPLGLGLVLVIIAALVLVRLGQRLLWQDEAQTALLARTVVDGGLPRGFDGRNYLSQELGAEYGEGYLWRWHTWLPFYVVAASFRVLGEGTFSARLPSALFAIATVALLYRFARRLWRDEVVGLVAAGLLALHVPFVLLARQCRYYLPAAFFALVGLDAYLGVLAGRRWARVLFVAAATSLFHTHYLYCFTLLAAVGLHALVWRRQVVGRLIAPMFAITIINLPFLVWLSGMRYGDRYGGDVGRLGHVAANTAGFVQHLLFGNFPLALLAVVAGFALYARRKGRGLGSGAWREPAALLGLFAGFTVAALGIASPGSFYRYLAPVLPVGAAALAPVVVAIARGFPAAPLALVASHLVSPPLWGLVRELSTDFHGPVEALVEHFNRHARPGETLAITYEDLPVKFYTDLRVMGGLTGEDLTAAHTADWIVLRQHTVCEKDAAVAAELRRHVRWERYEKVTLAAVDTRFGNREALPDHPFVAPADGPPVAIYRRVR
jgi:Dolichyl-phosphate-mannose-protein mannosyltransferase